MQNPGGRIQCVTIYPSTLYFTVSKLTIQKFPTGAWKVKRQSHLMIMMKMVGDRSEGERNPTRQYTNQPMIIRLISFLFWEIFNRENFVF